MISQFWLMHSHRWHRSGSARCAAILFNYVRNRSVRATFFHVLLSGIHCIYHKKMEAMSIYVKPWKKFTYYWYSSAELSLIARQFKINKWNNRNSLFKKYVDVKQTIYIPRLFPSFVHGSRLNRNILPSAGENELKPLNQGITG